MYDFSQLMSSAVFINIFCSRNNYPPELLLFSLLFSLLLLLLFLFLLLAILFNA